MRHILVVEPNSIVAEAIRRHLNPVGWSTSVACSGLTARTAIRTESFSTILCDSDVGASPSAIDILRQVRSSDPVVPFIIFRGQGSTDVCREAFLNGVTDVVEKPILSRTLLAAIAGHRDRACLDEGWPTMSADGPERHVKHASDLINSSYGDRNLTIRDIAKTIDISHEHLARLFMRRLGCSPLDYLHTVRFRESIQRLRQTDSSIKAIAIDCGYKSTGEFDRQFARRCGLSPGEIRNKERQIKK